MKRSLLRSDGIVLTRHLREFFLGIFPGAKIITRATARATKVITTKVTTKVITRAITRAMIMVAITAVTGMVTEVTVAIAAVTAAEVDMATDEMNPNSWYELKLCAGCGKRMEIGASRGRIESKHNYNNRNFHNAMCETLIRVEAPIKHGTVWGYERCHERPGGACSECRRRNSDRARKRLDRITTRALQRLAEEYPDKFTELLET